MTDEKLQLSETEKLPRVRSVLCDTLTGLRLATFYHSGNREKTETTAREILEKLDAGLALLSNENPLIIVVPPFVSDDLTRDHDYLQIACAEIVRDRLATMPNALLLESEEAHALSTELASFGAGETRLLKELVFLTGHYRHDASGLGQSVGVYLTLSEKGEVLRGATERLDNALAMAPYLSRALSAALAQMKSHAPSPPDAKSVADELAQKAKDLRRLGEFDRAIRLAESSLLYNPDKTDMRILIPESIAHLSRG